MENSYISSILGAKLSAKDPLKGIINIAEIMMSDIDNGDMDGDDFALKEKLCNIESNLNEISGGVNIDLQKLTLLELRKQAQQKIEYQQQHLKNLDEAIQRGANA